MTTGDQTAKYADLIMTAIHADMQRPFEWGPAVPFDVGSFTALHDYCDANMYVLTAMGEVDTYIADAETPGHNALVNAIMDEVDRRLAAEAATIHQDARDHPHDEPCPRCGRRQWTDETAQETCQSCGYAYR